MKDETIELHLIFKGDVQGVGFRATTMKFARQSNLKGTASNLSDGTVEVYVQGTKPIINQFIQSLKTHFGENIQQITVVNEEVPAILFNNFKIIH